MSLGRAGQGEGLGLARVKTTLGTMPCAVTVLWFCVHAQQNRSSVV